MVKRDSKKHGFIYYARFSHNGKMLPTKFNTRTNNLLQAEQYAKENKQRLIEQYLARQDGRMFRFLESFFDDNTDNPDVLRLSGIVRNNYKERIVNKFIPYLKSEKIASFDQIKPKTLINYQDKLLSGEVRLLAESGGKKTEIKRLNPQTVNSDMKPVKKIFSHLARKGIIPENIAERVKCLTVYEEDKNARGCYELEKLKGVFNKKWKNEISCILCMLIYTTEMRNSEIRRIKLEDIQSMDGCKFISEKKSIQNYHLFLHL